MYDDNHNRMTVRFGPFVGLMALLFLLVCVRMLVPGDTLVQPEHSFTAGIMPSAGQPQPAPDRPLFGFAAMGAAYADIPSIARPAVPVYEEGERIGTIRIESAGIVGDLAVGKSVAGAQTVMRGASCILDYDGMVVPGEDGRTIIAGHNYAEFNSLKHTQVGDTVRLSLPHGEYVYTIVDILIKPKTDLRLPDCDLIVYTCYPFDQGPGTTQNAYFICALSFELH